MKLLWLDLETTGLDAQKNRILEIACFTTDLSDPFTRDSDIINEQLPVYPHENKFDDFIENMHAKNGLLAECRRIGLCSNIVESNLKYYENNILSLIPKKKNLDSSEVTTLAGSSVHFDLSFLRVHMPELAANVSHRVYDVSSIKLFCRSIGMPKLPKEEAHRALKDIYESMAHARECEDWILNLGV